MVAVGETDFIPRFDFVLIERHCTRYTVRTTSIQTNVSSQEDMGGVRCFGVEMEFTCCLFLLFSPNFSSLKNGPYVSWVYYIAGAYFWFFYHFCFLAAFRSVSVLL